MRKTLLLWRNKWNYLNSNESTANRQKCVYFAESEYYHDYLCKYHGYWLDDKDKIDDGWVCEHFNRKG